MKSSPLLWKAIGALALVFGVTMAASAGLTAWRIHHNMTTQYVSKATAIANSIAGSSVELFLFGDASTIQALIDQFLEIEGVAYVYVADAQGDVLAHTFTPTIPDRIRDLEENAHETVSQPIHLDGHGEFLDVASPILAGKVGYVHVGMNQGRIRAAIGSALVRQTGLMFLIFFASLLAACWMMNQIVRPLNHLTRYANHVASSGIADSGTPDSAIRYPPSEMRNRSNPQSAILPVATRQDEVGQLARAFQHLVREVAAREQELRDAHDQLEVRVRERTAELLRANERLQEEIAERNRAEETVRRTAQELARSNAELEQFAYIASHDLQEPLRKVQAFGDMLVSHYRDTLGEEGQDYLQRMQNASKRMQVLINDLLSYSRVTTKGKPFEQVDLAEVARLVVTDLEARIRETGGCVEVGDLPELNADPMQMRQLLQNLIGNALKFHRRGVPPRVRVSAQLRGPVEGWRIADSSITDSASNPPSAIRHPPSLPLPPATMCELMVEDSGIGFDEKYLERLFAPFQRLHGRGEYEGTGMGLAICRKIVERHGGTIRARSVPDRGTTFLVTLPLRQPKGAADE